jgi:hypothetical protein
MEVPKGGARMPERYLNTPKTPRDFLWQIFPKRGYKSKSKQWASGMNHSPNKKKVGV